MEVKAKVEQVLNIHALPQVSDHLLKLFLMVFLIIVIPLYLQTLLTSVLENNNQAYLAHLFCEASVLVVPAGSECPICSYAATLLIGRIVSESRFCSRAR